MDLAYLQAHMETFYLCSHLPIRAFNKEGTELLSTGSSNCFFDLKDTISSWLREARTSLLHKGILTCSPDRDIYFTLCPIVIHSLDEGFYLIGPYTNNPDLKDDYLFKPDHCMPHLVSLLYRLGETNPAAPFLGSEIPYDSSPAEVNVSSNEDYSYHISKAEQYIKTHYDEPITLDALAQYLGLNKSYFCTIFKKATKDSFCNYTNKVRVEESKKLLRNSNASILDIALAVGFSSASYFNTIFKKIEGKTPLDYRKSI